MLATSQTDLASVAGMGAFLFFLTKFESIHLGRILVSRTRPETARRREFWRRFAWVGGAVSMLALAGALSLAGTLAGVIDRDLEFTSSAWRGSRTAAEWAGFEDDPDVRSQWWHRDGWVVSIFAYPLGGLETFEQFRSDFRRQIASQGFRNVVEDTSVPGSLEGFRYLGETVDGKGGSITMINYFVYDKQNKDIHHLVTFAEASAVAEAESRLRELLGRSRWIAAVEPAYDMPPSPAEAPAGR